jgi:glycogen operon protein
MNLAQPSPVAPHAAPAELGASLVPGGVHFALAAPEATAVELCLYDPEGRHETARLALSPDTRDATGGVWHALLPCSDDEAIGLVYGWRVHGPWAPEQGLRFNPAKLLLDPWAREVLGRYDGSALHQGDERVDGLPTGRPCPLDNGASALKARVVADLPPLQQPRPRIDPARRVIYELHVKGFSALNPALPPALRGSYAGLAHPASIAHLQALGITTVSLMPVAFRADEARLQALGLSNHWGYSTVGWSAPETRYWSGSPGSSPRTEFRAMVEALHAAGLEVVLDVVYNHSAETDELGPTLSLRGIANRHYYQLEPDNPARYANWTGCGNCLDLNQPLALRLVMDSLRRWVGEFGVDGFRFDLAPVLAREPIRQQGRFNPQAPLLAAIAQDPLLRPRLMIAEPWDIGPGGYQLGAFPSGWLEWNDRFRDEMRAQWLLHTGTRGALAHRLAGSSAELGRRPAHSSVNFVTAHDGFTLRDLVSYQHKHNLANGEDNRDGHSHNLSLNNGIEGDTDQPEVLRRRALQRRSLLAALCGALGTPMLLAGDELGHSQQGNNNAYCQDNPISWIDWQQADTGLCGFVRQLLALRHELGLLQAAGWWRHDAQGAGPQALWFSPAGQPLGDADWAQTGSAGLMLLLLPPRDRAPRTTAVLMLLNPGPLALDFCLPGAAPWRLALDTETDRLNAAGTPVPSPFPLAAGSLALLLADPS